MEPNNNSKKNIGIVMTVVVVLGVLGFTIFGGKKPDVQTVTDQTSSNTTNTSTENPQAPVSTPPKKVTTTPPPVDTPKKSASVYKNGTYSATGSYMSPGGEDQLEVTLSLKNDVITSVSVNPEPSDNTSARYQSKFVSGYQQFVLGKNIADVDLGKVSGSSLTPIGFNDAIEQIKSEAKA